MKEKERKVLMNLCGEVESRSTQSEGGCAHKLAFLFSVIFYNHEKEKKENILLFQTS